MKRKFRWMLEGNFPGGHLEQRYVVVEGRPDIFWGDEHWNEYSLSFVGDALLFLRTVPLHGQTADSFPPEQLGNYRLTLHDGCGTVMEEWAFQNAYILDSFRYSSEDYTSDDGVCEMTLRYKGMKYICHCNFLSKSFESDEFPIIGTGLGRLDKNIIF